MVSDLDVVFHPRLSADENARPDPNRSGEPRLRGHEGPRSNLDVVPDVYVRVELRPPPNRRGAECSRVHRRTGTDFDVVFDHDATELRNPDEVAGRPICEAEALTA